MPDLIKSDFLLYNSPSGDVKIEVFFQNETIWLTQKKMAELFGVDRTVITKHLKNIFETNELEEKSNVQKMHIPKSDKPVKFYNLDVIISVGYRVNSAQATHFRIWATKTLRHYMIKGFAIDEQRLKNGQNFGKDYFQELLETVRSIRTSEARIYKQITDIFRACAIDYDKNSDITKDFYATVQNKFHFAIAGETAAEIIHSRADKNKTHMGLTTWKNSPDGRILKSDVKIAKNYLSAKEIKKLERTISAYFDYIENQIENRQTMTMEQLAESVNKFLDFNDFKILGDKGKISAKQAEQKAFAEYDEFNKAQILKSDFDEFVAEARRKVEEI